MGGDIEKVQIRLGAVQNLLAVGRQLRVFFGEIGFGELLVLAVGVNDEEVATGFGKDVFVVGEPLDGVGGDTSVLPAEGFRLVDFDGIGLQFVGLEPLFRLLMGGIVKIDGALAMVGEALAVG